MQKFGPDHPAWDETAKAAEMVAEGRTIAEVGRSIGVSRRTLSDRLIAYRHYDPAIEASKVATGTSLTPSLVWVKTKSEEGTSYSVLLKPGADEAAGIEATIDRLCEGIADRAPKHPPPPKPDGEHLLVISPADIHMGKLAEIFETGDAYNQKIAEDRTKEGVLRLLETARGFGLEAITINTGNDSLHVDNTRKTTTSGTPQDTDGSLFGMFDAMFWTWVWVIETAAQYAPVHVVFDPSNHPWVSDWMLNRAVMAYFSGHGGVTFDVSMQDIRHRKYQVYGSNLIGYTHGDGARTQDLGQIMQHECREWWGKTMRGYWITKHMHHKSKKMVGLRPSEKEKDMIGVTVIRHDDDAMDVNVAVEIVRTPSGNDGWHDRNGFVGALKAVEAFLFHHKRGNVARFTYPFY